MLHLRLFTEKVIFPKFFPVIMWYLSHFPQRPSLKKYTQLHTEQTPLRVRFSMQNLMLNDDVLNIPLYLADKAKDIISLALSQNSTIRRWRRFTQIFGLNKKMIIGMDAAGTASHNKRVLRSETREVKSARMKRVPAQRRYFLLRPIVSEGNPWLYDRLTAGLRKSSDENTKLCLASRLSIKTLMKSKKNAPSDCQG